MKKIITIAFLLLQSLAQGQADFFGQRFNLDYPLPNPPSFRNERCNSGIRTEYNLGGTSGKFLFAATGTSYHNFALGAQHQSDQLRFIRLDNSGVSITNIGHQFDYNNNGDHFNASGNSIAEFDNKAGNGGYVAVGAVADNTATAAVAFGGSDILIAKLGPDGAVVNASLVDLNTPNPPASGKDEALCIRQSNFVYQGQHTFILCGSSQRSVNYTDCFVARISAAGTVLWINRYNFDPTGAGQVTAHCIARQLCEDANGNIYVAGTLKDNQGVNGVDGLAFSVDVNGTVRWANLYHSGTDDAFQAIRLTAAGSLIVGGFTNTGAVAPATHNMLLVNLNSSGAILFQNILPATDGATTYTSKGYDILEVPASTGVQYFLAGTVYKNNNLVEMLYKADKFGIGVNWYHYNIMNVDVGFGLAYDQSNCPGVAYFSSMRNPAAPGFSDSHIMKASLFGKSCVDNPMQSSKITVNLQIRKPVGRVTTGYSQHLLTYASYNYENTSICNQACAVGVTAGTVNQQQTKAITIQEAGEGTSSLKISPNPLYNTAIIQFYSLPEGEYEMSLIDMKGNLLQRSKRFLGKGSSNVSFDLSATPSGTYLLVVQKGDLVLKQKVVKQG